MEPHRGGARWMVAAVWRRAAGLPSPLFLPLWEGAQSRLREGTVLPKRRAAAGGGGGGLFRGSSSAPLCPPPLGFMHLCIGRIRRAPPLFRIYEAL